MGDRNPKKNKTKKKACNVHSIRPFVASAVPTVLICVTVPETPPFDATVDLFLSSPDHRLSSRLVILLGATKLPLVRTKSLRLAGENAWLRSALINSNLSSSFVLRFPSSRRL